MPIVKRPTDHPQQTVTVAAERVPLGGTVEVDEATAASLEEQGWTVTSSKAPTIDEVLDAVGTDAAAAAQAIADEQARPKPRPTLISRLEAIVTDNTKES